MSSSPEVSVVMGVYNSAESLERTLDSILSQEVVDLELIAINDGSRDDSAGILDRRASTDHRLIVVHQPNAGLTVSLRRGCELARGDYIARQDAGGDVSLPTRLAQQLQFLRANPDVVMASCGTRFVGPLDETLFDSVIDDDALNRGLSTLRVPGVSGPSHHGATMFRRDAYLRVGGYRPRFVVAQDMDLWLRLYEVGACKTISGVLYQARQTLDSISSRNGNRQLQYGALAVECARSRRAGAPEPEWKEPSALDVASGADSARAERAAFYYFIASCLRSSDKALATKYLREALRARPTHAGAWWRLLQLRWTR